MDKKIIGGYLVFCIFFFLALAAFLVIRVHGTWGDNARRAEEDFAELARACASLYLASGDWAAPGLRTEIRGLLEKRPRALAAVIYSRREGMLYAFLRQRSLMAGPGSTPWQGAPRYGTLPWGTRLLSLPFAPGQGGDLTIDGIYVIVGREDAFVVLRELFVILFAFLVLTGLVLLLAPAFADEGATAQGAEPGTQTGFAAQRMPAEFAPQRARAGFAGERGERAPELFSPATGLGWREHLEQRLKFELERAAALDQDLVLALIGLDDRSQREGGSAYLEAAAAIRRVFRYQDLAFEHDEGSFAVILPDHDAEAGIAAVEDFMPSLPAGLSASCGLAARNGRLVTGKTLLAEAQKALEKARSLGRGRIVAFRADPQRYRELVAAGAKR